MVTTSRSWYRGHTDAEELPYSCLGPLRHITPFATPHIKYFPSVHAVSPASKTVTSIDSPRFGFCQHRVSEPRDQDRFDPVIEILEANYR